MRHKPTRAEEVLRDALRHYGFVFNFQHVLLGKIVDFYFPGGSYLIVEVDGGYHETDEQRALDHERDAMFKGYGYLVRRLTNDLVLTDAKKAISRIFMRLTKEEQKAVVIRYRARKLEAMKALFGGVPA